MEHHEVLEMMTKQAPETGAITHARVRPGR